MVLLRFSVEDTGKGIAEENLEKIFQSFVHIENGSGTREGIGLGLTISQQLVSMMGGEIKVDSYVGKGSRFWFDIVIPVVADVITTDKEFVVPTGYAGKQKTVWVVDDNKDSRDVLQDMLEAWGFSLVTLTNGEDVLALAQEQKPDIVLMDIVMPKMDGYIARTALRELTRFKHVPIVAVSANIENTQQVLEAGFDGFIPKPIEQSLLKEVIGRQLKLEWVDASSKQDQPEYLLRPSEEQLQELYELVVLGKIQCVIEWSNVLEKEDPEYSAFSERVRELAMVIDKEGLKELISYGKEAWKELEDIKKN